MCFRAHYYENTMFFWGEGEVGSRDDNLEAHLVDRHMSRE